jgi:hypothetical protein
MEVHDKIIEIVTFVDSARTMPMSSSAVISKSELLSKFDELRALLPENLQAADAVLAEREALLAEARMNAERLVAEAQAEHARLVDEHSIMVAARIERDELLAAAQEEAASIRRDADDYVDTKLAHLELAAQRIVDTVREGRDRLQTRTPFDELATDEDELELPRGDDRSE